MSDGSSDASTPILDRRSPLPPPAPPAAGMLGVVAVHVAVLASLAAGVAFGVPPALRRWVLEDLPAQFDHQVLVRESPLERAALFVATLAAPFAMVVVHELGHALVGLAVGFRLESLRVGPVEVLGGARIRLHRRLGLMTSGVANLYPVARDRLALRAAAMVAAGPAANLITGFAVLLLPGTKGLPALAFVAASIGNGLGDLLPFENRIGASDGRRLWMLLFDRARRERWLALMSLQSQVRARVFPEAWSQEALAQAVAVEDDSSDTVTAHGFAFASAFHRRDDAAAARLLETCLRRSRRVAHGLRQALMSDAGVFQARRRGRPDLAEAWLNDLPARGTPAWLRLRVEAAILEARGDAGGAARKLAEIEALLAEHPDHRQRDWVLRLLHRWQAELAAPAS